jgi:hypothetical protein
MIYIITVIAALVLSFMMLASEALNGNITHLKNGREPNAGACIFPTIPCVPLFFCFISWIVEKFLKEYSIAIMLIVFAALYGLWVVGFMKLKSEFEALKNETGKANQSE